MNDIDLDAVREDCKERSEERPERHRRSPREGGCHGRDQRGGQGPAGLMSWLPRSTEVDGREAIVLTRPHVVAEFFHLDWTSQARRKLGVPVLHLLEHQNFDEQAEGL